EAGARRERGRGSAGGGGRPPRHPAPRRRSRPGVREHLLRALRGARGAVLRPARALRRGARVVPARRARRASLRAPREPAGRRGADPGPVGGRARRGGTRRRVGGRPRGAARLRLLDGRVQRRLPGAHLPHGRHQGAGAVGLGALRATAGAGVRHVLPGRAGLAVVVPAGVRVDPRPLPALRRERPHQPCARRAERGHDGGRRAPAVAGPAVANVAGRGLFGRLESVRRHDDDRLRDAGAPLPQPPLALAVPRAAAGDVGAPPGGRRAGARAAQPLPARPVRGPLPHPGAPQPALRVAALLGARLRRGVARLARVPPGVRWRRGRGEPDRRVRRADDAVGVGAALHAALRRALLADARRGGAAPARRRVLAAPGHGRARPRRRHGAHGRGVRPLHRHAGARLGLPLRVQRAGQHGPPRRRGCEPRGRGVRREPRRAGGGRVAAPHGARAVAAAARAGGALRAPVRGGRRVRARASRGGGGGAPRRELVRARPRAQRSVAARVTDGALGGGARAGRLPAARRALRRRGALAGARRAGPARRRHLPADRRGARGAV
ncbi:MAG: hypothetical protein AVDCRST_MAG11-696, partial [uncultured Gemmatimonadaceae bacterium]